MYFILNVVNKIKNDKKLLFLVMKLQARFRGLITRKGVKSNFNAKFLIQNDPYGNYVVVNSSKIVITTKNRLMKK